jgi:hypothetical protein
MGNGTTVVQWQEEGLRIDVPSGVLINVKPNGNADDTDNFTIIRMLINFEVLNLESEIVIRACYTKSERSAAGTVEDLKLAIWNGEDWDVLDATTVPGGCPSTLTGDYEGVKIVTVSEWSDPAMAWGYNPA